MIRSKSTFKLYWDILIIVTALYYSCLIPLEIGWNELFFASPEEITVESIINLIFMIDIFLNFRTTFISGVTGDEVFDTKQIGIKYIVEGRFILDVLSSIPFNAVSTNIVLPVVGMLKLFRVGKISTVIRNLNIRADTKAFLKILWLIFFIFLFVHVVGCLWFYIVTIDEDWVPWKNTIYEG